jgi:glycosyltransferase involved in cell wall biosynthesis
MMRRIVAISDYCSRVPPLPPALRCPDHTPPWRTDPDIAVCGGYLERLPLAAVRCRLADAAEVWSFTGDDAHATGPVLSAYGVTERRFRAEGHPAPYGSAEVLDYIARFGAPEILCVWGLGVTEDILRACATSVILYNSLDVDALRIPPEISRHVDIFLTASPAQDQAVRARHPGAPCLMLPVGPEFASAQTFFPMPVTKVFDVIYVAAAQDYKRHDILFEALAHLPRRIRALCVMGYGEKAEMLRAQAAEMGLDVTFVGPPAVSHAEVNALMNLARIGVVCGENDGAPAILTEYMLAGLPVLANADLACGLQYIRPDTGRVATRQDFARAIAALLPLAATYAPRAVVLENWSWTASMARLAPVIAEVRENRQQQEQV